MKKNYKIYSNVKLGKDVSIGDFAIIGIPAKASKGAKTVIGNGAVIRSHTVVYAGNVIGKNFQTGHSVLIRENNTIGDNVSIGSGSNIEHHIEIGNNVRIHSRAFIPEFSVLKEGAWVGPCVVMTNALHPLCPKVKLCLKGPLIEKDAKIGANSTILPGITIGKMAIVGAGSVVVNDVKAYSVVIGNPAKKVKDVNSIKCPYNLVKKPYRKIGKL